GVVADGPHDEKQRLAAASAHAADGDRRAEYRERDPGPVVPEKLDRVGVDLLVWPELAGRARHHLPTEVRLEERQPPVTDRMDVPGERHPAGDPSRDEQ